MLAARRGFAHARAVSASIRSAAALSASHHQPIQPRWLSTTERRQSSATGSPWEIPPAEELTNVFKNGRREGDSFIWGSLTLKDGSEVDLCIDGLSGRYLQMGEWQYPVQQLRDSCTCSLCRNPSSGQKTYTSTSMVEGMRITRVRVAKDGRLVITIDKDMKTHGGSQGHEILLSSHFMNTRGLKRVFQPNDMDNVMEAIGIYHWNSENIQPHLETIDYEDFMEPKSNQFWDVVRSIIRYGFVFLKNVPRDEESVVRIAERIANIRETFYGRTFDVRAKPNAENVAYTSDYLGLHQDLLYLSPPPHLQILHCMDNSCEGGDSIFSDGYRVGRMLRMLQEKYPIVNELENIDVPYGYNRDGHIYHHSRFVLPKNNSRPYIYWSPPFMGEWTRPDSWTALERWRAVARVLEVAINHPHSVYKTRLEPGTAVIFNNLRVMHGRTAFNAEGGSRWLRGAYIAKEDFLSTALQLPELNDPETLERVDWPPLDTEEERLKKEWLFEWMWKKLEVEEHRDRKVPDLTGGSEKTLEQKAAKARLQKMRRQSAKKTN